MNHFRDRECVRKLVADEREKARRVYETKRERESEPRSLFCVRSERKNILSRKAFNLSFFFFSFSQSKRILDFKIAAAIESEARQEWESDWSEIEIEQMCATDKREKEPLNAAFRERERCRILKWEILGHELERKRLQRVRKRKKVF